MAPILGGGPSVRRVRRFFDPVLRKLFGKLTAVIVAVDSFFHKTRQFDRGARDSGSLHLRNPLDTKIVRKGEGKCGVKII